MAEQEQSKLLPCPFCGRSNPFSGTTLDDSCYVVCGDDDCSGMVGYSPTIPEAIAAWNTRTPTPNAVNADKALAVVPWPNGCNRTAPAALRFLARYDRPIGGEQTYNASHLEQIAGELEAMASKPLYTTPAPDKALMPEAAVGEDWKKRDFARCLDREAKRLQDYLPLDAMPPLMRGYVAELSDLLSAASRMISGPGDTAGIPGSAHRLAAMMGCEFVPHALKPVEEPEKGAAGELDSYEKFDGVGLHSETIETRARIGEAYLECYESALSDPLLAGYTPADCPSELLLDLLERYRIAATNAGQVEAKSISVAEEWSVYMDDAVAKAPEPLRNLGEFLAGVLDEDHWKTAERYLNAAALKANGDAS